MTTTRRRLAVVTTSTFALLGAAVLPASAGTHILAGCTLADDHYTSDRDDETTVSHSDATKSITVDPGGQVLSGAASATGGVDQEDCDIEGRYTDEVVVRSATLPEGTEVELSITMRFDGSITTSDAGSYSAAAVYGAYLVTGPVYDAEGADERAGAAVVLSGQTYGASGTWSYDWEVFGDDERPTGWADGEGTGTQERTIAPTTATFVARVGEQLDVRSTLDLQVSAQQTTATAAAPRFEVVLDTDDPAVVLDRGDTPPSEEPEPETPLELVRQARDLLAGYDLNRGIARSLDVKLRDAENELIAEQDACDALASFQSHLSAQSGKHVTPGQAAELGALIAQAQDQLGC